MVYTDESPLVAVILVNWNSCLDTMECVDSIKQSTYKNLSIVIVDNGSVDGSVERLKERSDEYQLILSAENTGFTGGNNLGIAHAMSLKAGYILLLNNDTFIESSAIEKLVAAGKGSENIGVVTPKILFHPDRHLIWAAGTSFNPKILMGVNLGYKLEDDPIYNIPAYLDYAVGCALLIRRDVIETVGMLTEDYFATWEDVDFGLRVNRSGYKIRYEPAAVVWHKESVSAGGADNPQYVYYQTRSAFVFQHRWSQSILNSVMGHSYYFAYCLLRIYRFLGCGNFRGIVAILIAVFDAIGSRLGRRGYSILKKTRKI